MKKIIGSLFCLLVLLLIKPSAFAHMSNIDYDVMSGDNVGWELLRKLGAGIDGHMMANSQDKVEYTLVLNSTLFKDTISGTNKTYEEAISDAAMRWNATGQTNITVSWTVPTNGSSYGFIRDSDLSIGVYYVFGQFMADESSCDSNGHYKNGWLININTVDINSELKEAITEETKTIFTAAQLYDRVVGIVAHEIGHGFGLAHMLDSANADKLMYVSIAVNPANIGNKPTQSDIAGMKVITGIETAHSFTDVYDTSKHRSVCSTCKGEKVGSNASHSLEWMNTSTTHYRQCKNCPYKESSASHSFTSWQWPLGAGSEMRNCTTCKREVWPYIGRSILAYGDCSHMHFCWLSSTGMHNKRLQVF